MANDSSTGGYLAPASSPAPAEGQALEDFLQQVIVGITGLAGDLVRPRWQPTPPDMPKSGTDWCAYGITGFDADTYQVDVQGSSSDDTQRHEVIELLTSFYGTDAQMYAALLRDGLQVAQNREAMQLVGMGLVDTGPITPAPSLVKERWLYRVDMTLRIKRMIQRSYPVLTLLDGVISLDYETGSTTITAGP